MFFLSFSFANSLSFIVYALSSFSQMKMIELLEAYSHIIFMFLSIISLCCVIIFEDISIILNYDIMEKSKRIGKITIYSTSKKISLIQPENHEEKKFKQQMISISILSILAAINISLSYLNFLCLYIGFSGVICIFNNLISWLFLFFWAKRKIYRHYILSFIILLCALTASILLDDGKFELLNYYFGSEWYLTGFFILTTLATSSREVLEKYVLDVLYISYSKLLFYEGVGALIITMIVFGIIQLIPCELSVNDEIITIKTFCFNSKATILRHSIFELFSFINIETLYIWVYFISIFINDLFRIFINKKNGPTHRYSADLFAFALYMLIDILISFINNIDQIFDWKIMIITLVLILGCLIYNENIRLNICNLSYYTRTEIEQRSVIDSKMNDLSLINLEEIDDIDFDSSVQSDLSM